MSEFDTQLAALAAANGNLQAAIGKMNSLMTASEVTDVTIGGITKPSVSKQIAAKLGEISNDIDLLVTVAINTASSNIDDLTTQLAARLGEVAELMTAPDTANVLIAGVSTPSLSKQVLAAVDGQLPQTGVEFNSEFFPLIVDSLDNVITYLDRYGKIYLQALTIKDEDISSTPENSNLVFGVADSLGNIAIGVTKNGDVILPNPANPLTSFSPHEINHLFVSGQSLSVGGGTLNTVSADVAARSLTFNEGMRLLDGVTSTGLMPTPAAGEFVAARAAARHLVLLLNRKYSPTQNLLLSGHGKSGYSITQLNKGTAQYAQGANQLTQGRLVASSLGYASKILAGIWIQGEADSAMTKSAYYSLLSTLIDDYRADNKEHIPFFTYQLSSEQKFAGNVDDPQIAGALYDITRNKSKVYMACPTYFWDYVDGVHLSGLNYIHMGAYFGKALYEYVVNGSFIPVRPTNLTINGKIILIEFHVPVAPLVIDTSVVSDPGGYGFEAFDDAGYVSVSTVSVLPDGKSVKITASRELGAGAGVSYAWRTTVDAWAGRTTGPRGCLRDSDGSYDYDGNILYNYCVRFKHTRGDLL